MKCRNNALAGMHFSYIAMLQSIPVMDETNNYRLWEQIQITCFHIFLARNKIFTSLISVNSHIKSTKFNDDPVVK